MSDDDQNRAQRAEEVSGQRDKIRCETIQRGDFRLHSPRRRNQFQIRGQALHLPLCGFADKSESRKKKRPTD